MLLSGDATSPLGKGITQPKPSDRSIAPGIAVGFRWTRGNSGLSVVAPTPEAIPTAKNFASSRGNSKLEMGGNEGMSEGG